MRADTTWVPAFASAVSEYRATPGIRILAGVEAKILDTAGNLDLPADLPSMAGVDLVLIADHQFPGERGPIHPNQMRAAIEEGEMTAATVIECLAMAIMRAFGSARGSLLAHPFSLLPKMGLREEQIPGPLLTDMAIAAKRAGAMIEVNEKWRCPQPRTVAVLARTGVHLVAGSDSHHCRNVGIYRSVRDTARVLLPSRD